MDQRPDNDQPQGYVWPILLFIIIAIPFLYWLNITDPSSTGPAGYKTMIMADCGHPEFMGQKVTNPEFTELVNKIKIDIGRPDAEISMYIGEYQLCGMDNAELVPRDYQSSYFILFDKTFFNSLDNITIQTVIAHELGHMNYQIDADNNAIKYFGPDAVIRLLDKITPEKHKSKKEYQLRIANALKAKDALRKK